MAKKNRYLFLNNSFEKSSNSPIKEYLYMFETKKTKATFVKPNKIISEKIRVSPYKFKNQSSSEMELINPKKMNSLEKEKAAFCFFRSA